MHTYHDAVQNVLDYYNADPSAEAERYARNAVLAAYREVPNTKRWSYYLTRGRLNTVASYTTGTVVFDLTGGANERQLTLTTGTWPSWAALGTVRISNVEYDVASRISDSIVTLSELSTPPADIASSSYTLYRDTYPMPTDFVAAGELVALGHGPLKYHHPDDWVKAQRSAAGPGQPYFYTFKSDPNYFGAIAVSFFPGPDAAYEIDYIYQRHPRTITTLDYNTGTATTSAASATVTGSGTAWASSMVGTVIRFSEDALNTPTGPGGLSPSIVERVVSAVGSATSLTLDAVAGATLSGVRYRMSDPIDIEAGAMLSFFQRECERQGRLARRMESTKDEMFAYTEARALALEGDARDFSRRAVGDPYAYRQRLADMPRGPDIS